MNVAICPRWFLFAGNTLVNYLNWFLTFVCSEESTRKPRRCDTGIILRAIVVAIQTKHRFQVTNGNERASHVVEGLACWYVFLSRVA